MSDQDMGFLIPCMGNKKKDEIFISLEVRKCGRWLDSDLGDEKPLLVQNHWYKTDANRALELGEEVAYLLNQNYGANNWRHLSTYILSGNVEIHQKSNDKIQADRNYRVIVRLNYKCETPISRPPLVCLSRDYVDRIKANSHVNEGRIDDSVNNTNFENEINGEFTTRRHDERTYENTSSANYVKKNEANQYYSRHETPKLKLTLKAPRSMPKSPQPNSSYLVNPSSLKVANIDNRNERNFFTRTDSTSYIFNDTWSSSQPICEHNLNNIDLSGSICRFTFCEDVKLGRFYDATKNNLQWIDRFSRAIPEMAKIWTEEGNHTPDFEIKHNCTFSEILHSMDADIESQVSAIWKSKYLSSLEKLFDDIEEPYNNGSSYLIIKGHYQVQEIDFSKLCETKCMSSSLYHSYLNATHFIYGLKYSSVSVIKLKAKRYIHKESEKFAEDILTIIKDQILSNTQTSSPEYFKTLVDNFDTSIFSTKDHETLNVSFNSWKQLIDYLSSFEKLVPITCKLLPISSLIKRFNKQVIEIKPWLPLEVPLLQKLLRKYENSLYLHQKCITKSRALVSKFIPRHACDKIENKCRLTINYFNDPSFSLAEDVMKLVEGMRKGTKNEDDLNDFLKKLTDREEKFEQFVQEIYRKYFEKIQFLKKIEFEAMPNFRYVQVENRRKIDDLLYDYQNIEMLYIFFCYFDELSSETLENLELFEKLLGYKGMCLFLDMECYQGTTKISQYSYGKPEYDNLLNRIKWKETHNVIKCSSNKIMETKIFSTCTDMNIPCPNPTCSQQNKLWYCNSCEHLVTLDSENFLFCKCGMVNFEVVLFHCIDKKHPHNSFVPYTKVAWKRLFKQNLNILVIGETGVGKSTWINALANYLSYQTLEEATQKGLKSPIPTKFYLTDDNFEPFCVEIGKSKNEVLQQGKSSTQTCQMYILPYENHNIRIIDTPGIGDERGYEQDKKNIQNILCTLKFLDKIHGICLLLPPHNARLTLIFQYCLNELLAQLHKSAISNFVICFTNARKTLFKPGNTFPMLMEFLKDLEEKQGSSIQLSKNTIYHLDNEAYRFLCANNKGITFNDDDLKNFKLSWDKSKSETERMIDFIKQLPSHNVQETLEYNEARRFVLTMSKPLTEMINEINSKINRKQECAEILESTLSSVEQRQNKFTSSRNSRNSLKITRDDHPTICCINKSCMKVERILNTDIYQNIQKVCRDADGDFLQNIVISEKKFRKYINRPGYCETCGCDWTFHVFNEYNLNQFFELVQTPSGEKKWDPNVSQTLVELLEKNKKAIKKFAQEKSFILEVGRKFGAFLSKNSILASNDAFEQFLLQSIEEERKISQLMKDTSKLNALIKAHEEYKHERNRIENWLDFQNTDISIEEIFLLQEDLFNNKHFGAKMKKIWDEELSQYQAIQCVEHFIGSNHFEEIERL